jgi:hypothetical protein
MSTMIHAAGGNFYSNDEPEEVKAAIDRGIFLDVWWYASWGQRFSERAWFAPDSVEMVRSESDD